MNKAAFIFLAPETDPKIHRETVKTPTMDLEAIGVPNYEKAAEVAKQLADEGVACIELCGGFGIRGMWAVKEAVGDQAEIGAVRFDGHPGLGWKSGDQVF